MTDRDSRYAPSTPNGMAATTNRVRANPTAPKSTVPRAPIKARAGGAGDDEPSPVNRHAEP